MPLSKSEAYTWYYCTCSWVVWAFYDYAKNDEAITRLNKHMVNK